MSAEVAAAKVAVAVASDKRGRVAIATILCSIIMLFFLPLIVYMGVMSNLGEVEIDTVQAQQMIVQNMSAEEKAKLQHLEDVMVGIGKEFQNRKLNNYTIKKAQALYVCALYDVEKTDTELLTPAFETVIGARLDLTEYRLSQIIFKLAFEMAATMNILAGTFQLDAEKFELTKDRVLNEVKAVNGAINLKDIIDYQNGETE